jgi:hypothetical protein
MITPAGYQMTISYPSGAFATQLVDVPMLLVLNAANFNYALAASDGSDLRAFDAEGNALPLEVESFDSSGTSIVWVLLPILEPAGDAFDLRFGDPNAAEGPGPSALCKDYTAVYHFADGDPNIAVTPSVGTASGAGTAVTRGPAQIGHGASFNSTTSWIDVGNAPSWEVPELAVRTVSVWFQRDVDSQKTEVDFRSMVLMRAARPGCQGWSLSVLGDLYANTRASAHLEGCSISAGVTSNPGLGSYYDEAWHHFAAVFDRSGGELTMYTDAAVVAQGPLPTTGAFDSGSSAFGVSEVDAEHFGGLLDEARIRTAVEGVPWLTATMKIAQDRTYLTYGAITPR